MMLMGIFLVGCGESDEDLFEKQTKCLELWKQEWQTTKEKYPWLFIISWHAYNKEMDTCIYASAEDSKGMIMYEVKDLLQNKRLYYCEMTEIPNKCATPFDEAKEKYWLLGVDWTIYPR